MDVSKQLARTEHIKHATYWGDGMGRDSYILTGNGGLVGDANMPTTSPWTGYQPTNATTALYTNQAHQFKRLNAHKDATAFRYFGDGSGRDSYVVADSGGLVPKYVNKGVQQSFQNSLRQHESNRVTLSINRRTILNAKNPTTPQPGAPTHDPASGMWYKDSVRQAIKNCYHSQRRQSNRLSNPKTQRSKFQNTLSGQVSIKNQPAATQRRQHHSLLMMDLEKMTHKAQRKFMPAASRNDIVVTKSHRNSLFGDVNTSKTPLPAKTQHEIRHDLETSAKKYNNGGTVRMSSLGEKNCELRQEHEEKLQKKIRGQKQQQVKSYQRVPAVTHSGELYLQTEGDMDLVRGGSPDLIEPMIQALNSATVKAQTQTNQRLKTSVPQKTRSALNSHQNFTQGAGGSSSNKHRMRQSDFKGIQKQIAQYQKKIRELQSQSKALDQLEYTDELISKDHMSIKERYRAETGLRKSQQNACQTQPVTRSGSICDERKGESSQNIAGATTGHNTSIDQRPDSKLLQYQQQSQMVSMISNDRQRDILNNSDLLFNAKSESLTNPYKQQDVRVKTNRKVKGAERALGMGVSSSTQHRWNPEQSQIEGTGENVWQSLDQYQFNKGARGARNGGANHSVDEGRLSYYDGRNSSMDRRYNSLERQQHHNRSMSSTDPNNDYDSNEPIKVLNGKEAADHPISSSSAWARNGGVRPKAPEAIDFGGQTLETSLRGYESTSPQLRKPQTAAHGSSKRRNLKELIKLFQNASFKEQGGAVVRQGSQDASLTRRHATLEPKESKSKDRYHRKSSQNQSNMMHHQTTRAFTQMSGEKEGDFKIDLRDQCTATAKLEKLKQKYQRQAQALNGSTSYKARRKQF